MRVLMLTEYFYPNTFGGSEQSVFYLIQQLLKKHIDASVLTPGYRNPNFTSWRKIKIHRFYFPLSLESKKYLSPFWYTNPIWYIYTFLVLFRSVKKLQVNIIHVHSKSFIPAAILVKYVLNIPVIVTLRDYQTLCPYGLCIKKSRAYQHCSFFNFLMSEIPEYYQLYNQRKTLLSWMWTTLTGAYSWFTSFFLRFFINYADRVICISKKQKKIFVSNKIKIFEVIYNTFLFKNKSTFFQSTGRIVYVGRLTHGKGFDVFFNAINEINKHSRLKVSIVGTGYLKKMLIRSGTPLQSNISYYGQIPYEKALAVLRRALLVVIPSRWEEPFGRVALEALAHGVPIVASNRGGLPEIVGKRYGIITFPDEKHFTQAILAALADIKKFRGFIRNDWSRIVHDFQTYPIEQYYRLYQKLFVYEKI